MNIPTRLAALLLISLVLISCATFTNGLTPGGSPQPSQTVPTVSGPTATLPPPHVAIATLTPTPQPALARPLYQIEIQLDYTQRSLRVKQTLTAANPTPKPLASLTLVMEPSRGKDVFKLTGLQDQDGRSIANWSLDKGLLTIPLPQPVAARASFTLTLSYEIKVPITKSWLGFTGRQLNLGDWYPFLPAYQEDSGWLIHEPSQVGEYLVYPAADYQVDLTLADSPYKLVVAASVPPSRQEGSRYHYEMTTARAFALSISPEFQTQTSGRVTAYYFAEHARAARASLETTSAALDYFSQLYGDYPYSGLALVEGDFFDGMEYSGLFFLGTDYFTDYPGSPLSYLTPLSAHETAHQWFYSLVGDDPALEPWLDEAFCTYSEQLYFEHARPDLVQWWTFYRISRYTPDGRVDSSVYDHTTFRPYVNAVYLRGAQFLNDLRTQAGDEVIKQVLRELVSTYSGRLITASDFWSLLRAHTDQDLSELTGQYFKNPPQ